MVDERPYILVVGAADTGRTLLVAALLRRELGAAAMIASAGVVGHAGEPAEPNAHLALEQFGLAQAGHVARQLDEGTMRDADLLLGVDRGSARAARVRAPGEVAALSDLACAEDVPDPHRMPLGVWIAAVRAYEAQVAIALRTIRTLAGIDVVPAPGSSGSAAQAPRSTPPVPSAAEPSNARLEHIQRIVRLLDTARVLPEIVDWGKLAQEAVERLQSIAASVEHASDFTPAAAAMLTGLFLQTSQVPGEARLNVLRGAVERLEAPLDAMALADLAQIAGRWTTI